MTLLPIVERELRVAARQRFTFWSRLGTAGLALLVYTGLQLIAEASRGGGFKAGEVQFAILKWICFLFACAAGVFLTADSLSEEKREGTLGLLFLTDLKGYDVVLGKLISHSLQAFYGLLAALPVLGLTILGGGVAGAEFTHTLLIICNTLFLSLCVGLFISSVSRDVMKAMNGALFLCLFILVGLPLIDGSYAGWNNIRFKAVLSLASPGYLMVASGFNAAREFWFSLGLQHALAWALLILSSLCVPRAWQEKTSNTGSTGLTLVQRWRYGGRRYRSALRRKLLERDPVLWLAMRDRWLPRFVWFVMLVALAWLGWSLVHFQTWQPLIVASYLQMGIGFGLMLWLAAQASRFFVDAIRNGALELVLVTPVTADRIVRNHWLALWRTFLVPALFLVLLGAGGQVALWFELNGRLSSANSGSGFIFLNYQFVAAAVGIVKFLGNLAAVGWFGMWMGLTTRKASIAVLKTLCVVVVLPALVLLFAQGMMMFAFNWARLPTWSGLIVVGALSVAKNIFFIMWARQRLFTRFRDAVLREARPPRNVSPPPLPPAMSPPPIFAAGRS